MPETPKSTDLNLRRRVIPDPVGEAYKLRLSGMSQSEIAKQGLGYNSAQDVSKAITSRLKHEARLVSADDRSSLLALELDRLDALQAAVWSEAMSGEPKAVDSAVKIIMNRAKLLGLDLPNASEIAQTVLVIRGDEDDYVNTLKIAGRHSKENNG